MSIVAGQRWTHVKRGTTYEVIGIGELQMSADLVDGSSLVIYRGDDGKLWAREEGEFLDGRFEPVRDRYKFDPRMTHTTNDAPVTVRVNDDDREAAADLAHALGMECETFTSGAADILVQHLARHRLAALASAPAGVETDGGGDVIADAIAREGWHKSSDVKIGLESDPLTEEEVERFRKLRDWTPPRSADDKIH